MSHNLRAELDAEIERMRGKIDTAKSQIRHSMFDQSKMSALAAELRALTVRLGELELRRGKAGPQGN